MRNQADRIGIADSVKFAGFQSDVSRYYLDADALLCTSEIEGFCLVLAEACACGTPVVAYDLPYLPFAECAGIAWVPQGAISEAADALTSLLQDNNAWQSSSAEEQLFMLETLRTIVSDSWNDVLDALSGDPVSDERSDDETQMWDALLNRILEGEACVHEIIDDLNHNIEAQRSLRAELEASYSYRVGHAVLAGPRAIHQRLSDSTSGAIQGIEALESVGSMPHAKEKILVDLEQAIAVSKNAQDSGDAEMWTTLLDHYRRSQARIWQHLQNLRQELKTEEQLTQELERSRSYRVGHALLTLPRLLRAGRARLNLLSTRPLP